MKSGCSACWGKVVVFLTSVQTMHSSTMKAHAIVTASREWASRSKNMSEHQWVLAANGCDLLM